MFSWIEYMEWSFTQILIAQNWTFIVKIRFVMDWEVVLMFAQNV